MLLIYFQVQSADRGVIRLCGLSALRLSVHLQIVPSAVDDLTHIKEPHPYSISHVDQRIGKSGGGGKSKTGRPSQIYNHGFFWVGGLITRASLVRD